MKLSVWPGQKGFALKGSECYRVTMDDRPLEQVFQVDTCTGVAWVADTDKDGNVRIDRKKDEIMVRKVYGPMRVELI